MSLKSEGDHNYKIQCLVVFPKGLVFSEKSGSVTIYRRHDDTSTAYSRRASFSVPASGAAEEDPSPIASLDVSPDGQRLLVSAADRDQLYHSEDLWQEHPKLRPLGQELHQGGVGALATCAWKPWLLATYGLVDRSVRLWDVESLDLVFVQRFQENILCLALHPSGLFLLLGFAHKLGLKAILEDELKSYAELPLMSCEIVEYSRGGHLFAAVQGNLVHVYASADMRRRFTLRGHASLVKVLKWAQDDGKLYSMGAEGAVYEWDMGTGVCTAEVVFKGIELRDLAPYALDSCVVSLADDGWIRRVKGNDVCCVLRPVFCEIS